LKADAYTANTNAGIPAAKIFSPMSITDTFKTTPNKTLKNLIQILHDGQEGFKKASESVKDSSLKEVFSRYSLQRSQLAGELESELLTLGEKDPQDEGSTVTGAIHRGWIDLKAALTRGDNHSVLAEAERGEDAAFKAYKDALEETDLPANLRQTIAEQAVKVKAGHEVIRSLRDAAKQS
jgi:uncharacterized protein (TIGR02284 family)